MHCQINHPSKKENMELTSAIQEAIRNGLSGAVAEELKQFIADAQRNSTQLAKAKDDVARLTAEIEGVRADLTKHRTLDAKLMENEAKEKDLLSREVQLRLDTAMNRAMIAEAQLKTGMDIFGLVFRNATVSQSILAKVPLAVEGSPGGNGNYGCPGTVQNAEGSSTTTTTQI